MKKKIGNDEFCLHCMEWREYDENGKCKICKHIIKKEMQKSEGGYNTYKQEGPSFEIDDESNTEEY